jgi:hypothetical protein
MGTGELAAEGELMAEELSGVDAAVLLFVVAPAPGDGGTAA